VNTLFRIITLHSRITILETNGENERHTAGSRNKTRILKLNEQRDGSYENYTWRDKRKSPQRRWTIPVETSYRQNKWKSETDSVIPLTICPWPIQHK
jgi:hypothetical protein